MSKKYFINFSGTVAGVDPELKARQDLLNKTAQQYGNVDETIAWQRKDLLDKPFYLSNQTILDQERGSGFWSWKPYIILETLKKTQKNDWVIYCDVGKPFRRGDTDRCGNMNIGNIIHTPMDSIIEYADNHNGFTPGIWIPHYGLAETWTKRDCFVGMNCDDQDYHHSPQVQAGYSAWSNSDASIHFLKEWLKWCQVPAIISDDSNIYGKPNLPSFRDHRHDQSILTNLCIKHKIELFGPREQSLNGYRNFNFILRHMMLSQSHKIALQHFSILFNPASPQLPIFLKEMLALLFLTESHVKPRILIHSDLNSQLWQQALTDYTIDLYPRELKRGHYDGIFIPYLSEPELSAELVFALFDSLKPGGLILLGRFKNSDSKKPSINGSFSELLYWIEKNQRLPDSCPIDEYKKPNALTVGSRLNPVISHTNNGRHSYAMIMKPTRYFLEVE